MPKQPRPLPAVDVNDVDVTPGDGTPPGNGGQGGRGGNGGKCGRGGNSGRVVRAGSQMLQLKPRETLPRQRQKLLEAILHMYNACPVVERATGKEARREALSGLADSSQHMDAASMGCL